eukprot:scaffold3.g6394.t1
MRTWQARQSSAERLQGRAGRRRRHGRSVPGLLLTFFLLSSGAVITLLVLYSQLHTHLGKERPAEQVGVQAEEESEAGRLARALPAACAARLGKAGLRPDGAATLSRRRLYHAMASALEDHPALGGRRIQGMGLSDILTTEGGVLRPVLKRLDVPVRAIVVPVTQAAVARRLADASLRHLVPLFPGEDGVWLQRGTLFHSTLYHASLHLDPVPASAAEVAAEARAIAEVARAACPLRVVLERVVATSTGAVLACWQVAGGADPAALRAALAAALPRASRRQAVQDRAILHTTLARLVKLPPGGGAATGRLGARQRQGLARRPGDEAVELVQRAVERMTQELCGVEATLDTLWFVQEKDRMALALDGEFSQQALPLQCQGQQQAGELQRRSGLEDSM